MAKLPPELLDASRWRLVAGMLVMNLRLQRPGQLRAQMPERGMWQVISGGEASWEEQGALVPLKEWEGVVAAADEQSGAHGQEPRQVVSSSELLAELEAALFTATEERDYAWLAGDDARYNRRKKKMIVLQRRIELERSHSANDPS